MDLGRPRRIEVALGERNAELSTRTHLLALNRDKRQAGVKANQHSLRVRCNALTPLPGYQASWRGPRNVDNVDNERDVLDWLMAPYCARSKLHLDLFHSREIDWSAAPICCSEGPLRPFDVRVACPHFDSKHLTALNRYAVESTAVISRIRTVQPS
jgi:hypothetical protein